MQVVLVVKRHEPGRVAAATDVAASDPADTATVATAPSEPRLTFSADEGFHRELKRRVADHFEREGVSSKGNARMYLKSAVLLAWLVASYVLLVFAATTWWHGALLAVSLALAMAGVGFGVQHDANHGAYSRRAAVNRAMGMTLDMLGASSFVWRFKHNVSHHTYTNIYGGDDDIDIGVLARLSPSRPRRRFHRLQHIYLWALYGFLMPKWHFVYDFKNVARGRVASQRFRRPRGLDLVQLVVGKLAFFGWALAIPMLFHRWWVVLLYYAATAMLLGVVLSVVFQLAHCVEEADFPRAPASGRMPRSWAVHQVQTTVDFARESRLLTWYLGGLNYQIEHHLFPRVCHVHYPRIAPIVEALCAELGLRYTAHQSFRGAVASHQRWLRRMGRSSPSELPSN